MVTVPIVSSISWDHHLAVLLLAYVLLAPWLRIGDPAWWATLASYPLVSLTSNSRTAPAAPAPPGPANR